VIHFSTLGALDLRGEDGSDYRPLLGRDKRVALLAYLAIAYAGRFCRRDTLLGIFWPELDASKARNALNQALHLLRRSLGDDVVVARGKEELGIDSSRLECDAVTLRRLASAGAHGDALAVYAGDLLPGFFVDGAPEFEHWVENERASLRYLAASSAWTLSSENRARGDLRDATRWANRGLELMPTDEPGMRRLLSLLDDAGNRVGALDAYEKFAQRLSAEFGLEPSPETRALIERIRARSNVLSDAGERILIGRISGGGEVSVAPSVAAAPQAIGHEATALVRVTRHRAVAIAAALVIVAGGMFATAQRSHGTQAAPARRTIAVLPFTVHGGSDYQYLGTGVADLLDAELADGRAVRSADAQLVLSLAVRAGATIGQPEQARGIARRVGAEGYVVGNVVEAGGRLEIDASLHDLDGNIVSRSHVGPADAKDLFELMSDLGARLFPQAPGIRESDLVQVARTTTASLPALTAYLEGETDFRTGRYEQAVAALRRAVMSDTTFAIAYYRLSIATIWNGGDARTPMEAAHKYEARLPEHQRQLVDAGIAWLRGDNTIAESIYRSVVARFPDDVEAWNQLGEICFHTNGARGRDPFQAMEPLHRVLQLDEHDASALWHLALLNADRPTLFDSLTRIALTLGPDSVHSFEIRTLRAELLGTPRDRAQVSRESAMYSPWGVEVSALRAAVFAGDPRAAREIMTMASFDVDPLARAESQQRRARFDAAIGHIALARREIDALRLAHPGSAAMERATLDLLPHVSSTRDELRAASRELVLWDAAHDHGRKYGSGSVRYYQALRSYLLARLSARLGDSVAAHHYADEIARLPVTDSTSLNAALAASARAFAFAERGDAERALTMLDSARREVWYAAGGESAPHAQAQDRYLRAELLRQLGRDDEALEWYASAERNSLDDVSYLAISHYRRAQILERHGKRAAAAQQYAAAASLWRDADADVAARFTPPRAHHEPVSGTSTPLTGPSDASSIQFVHDLVRDTAPGVRRKRGGANAR
jgi:DNA-binding SARP family transcriptional activator/TolB-like protein